MVASTTFQSINNTLCLHTFKFAFFTAYFHCSWDFLFMFATQKKLAKLIYSEPECTFWQKNRIHTKDYEISNVKQTSVTTQRPSPASLTDHYSQFWPVKNSPRINSNGRN